MPWSIHVEHCWRSRDEFTSDVLLWIPSHGRAKAGRPARTYIQQLEPTYSRMQWTIEKGVEKGSGISVLIARHDDFDIYPKYEKNARSGFKLESPSPFFFYENNVAFPCNCCQWWYWYFCLKKMKCSHFDFIVISVILTMGRISKLLVRMQTHKNCFDNKIIVNCFIHFMYIAQIKTLYEVA